MRQIRVINTRLYYSLSVLREMKCRILHLAQSVSTHEMPHTIVGKYLKTCLKIDEHVEIR